MHFTLRREKEILRGKRLYLFYIYHFLLQNIGRLDIFDLLIIPKSFKSLMTFHIFDEFNRNIR